MNPVVKYYAELAKDYDNDRFNNSYGRFIDSQERKVLNQLLLNKKDAVADLACGSGRLLDYATYGVDASSEMIAVAQSKFPEKELFVSDAGTLPFANDTLDAIISFHFFMHLDEEKIDAILKECHRVLKKGGRIIFDFPSAKRRRLLRYKTTNWHGATSFSLAGIGQVAPAGFTVKSTHGLVFFPIHRFPKGMRKFLAGIDRVISNSFLKEYSSYLIVEWQKK